MPHTPKLDPGVIVAVVEAWNEVDRYLKTQLRAQREPTLTQIAEKFCETLSTHGYRLQPIADTTPQPLVHTADREFAPGTIGGPPLSTDVAAGRVHADRQSGGQD